MAHRLTELCEDVIRRAQSTVPGGPPIEPRMPEAPILATERWIMYGHGERLVKTFRFRDLEQRNAFIEAMLNYEKEVKHCCRMVVTEEGIEITLTTKGIDRVGDLDREYARYADMTYKDVYCYVKSV